MNGLRHCGAVLFLFLSLTATAQEKKEPGQRDVVVPEQTQTPMPKIDLPEFLITGQETIDLPLSSKSSIDEERIFVSGTRAPGQKDADASPSTKQQKDLATPAGQMSGRVSAGFGNYVTPSIEGWFGKNYDAGGVLFHADYASTNGHVENAESQNTGVSVRGDYRLPSSIGVGEGSRLDGGINFSGESFRAFASRNPSQVRTLDRTDLNLHLLSHTAKLEKLDEAVSYSAGIFMNRVSLDDSLSASENRIGITGNAATQWKTYRFAGSLRYVTTAVSMTLPPGIEAHSPQWFDVDLSGSTFPLPSLQMSLALHQYVYRGNLSISAGRFYPNLDLRYYVGDAASIFACFTPRVEENTLGTLAGENKYIRNAIEFRPSDIPLFFTLGSDVSVSDDLRVTGAVSYKKVQDFPVFVEFGSAKVWDVMYLPEVHALRFEAEGSYRFSPKNTGTLTASFNSTAATDSSNDVPNLSAVTLAGAYTHAFQNGIMLEVFGEYASKRWIDLDHTGANAGHFTLGGRGEYRLIDNVRMMLEVSNLFNQQYYLWDGYVERPFFISLGVTYKW